MAIQMETRAYTQQIIKGVAHKRILPQGTALVLEGGGARTYFSAGVFDTFIDEGIMFPYIIGVSAGIANALSYVSGQRGRNRVIAQKYVNLKEYASHRNFINHKSFFCFDFIFGTIPCEHLFWDKEIFDSTNIRFLTGAIDCVTGKTVWFEKQDVTERFKVIQASCSVPFITQVVQHKGLYLLDGGVSDPIPIEKSIEDGNSFHVIVLTRNHGYVSDPFRYKRLLKLRYRRYPHLMDAIMKRCEIYARQLSLCEQLEREGKAIILRPQKPLAVGRLTTDTDKLMDLYDEGHEESSQIINALNRLA